MLDQTFSFQNFRRIYEVENRRGRNIDRAFFPDLVEASARITAASSAIRAARKANQTVSADALNLLLQPLRERLRNEREAREALVDVRIEEVSQAVLAGYQIQLQERTGPKGSSLYTLPSDACAYFIGKQIQRNISRLYHLKAGNRRAIISQLYDVLNNSFPCFCIRADVTRFYESIDRRKLISEMDSDQLLSHGTKKHIKQALSSYGQLSNSSVGIPRGLGISAFLSELYMRSIDEKVRQLPRVIFYARYVDDMIIVFAPTVGDNPAGYIGHLADILAEKGLALNLAKTRAGSTGAGVSFQFDYLGYQFIVAGGRCEVSIGRQKLARYRARIDRAFAAYDREAMRDQRGAARLLAARIKFMTTNTRLINNKRHAYTGIYFNNSHLTNWSHLNGLDAYLAHKVSQLRSAALQDRIDRFSFVRGFTERQFSMYNTRTLAKIVQAWHYET